jgi:hypothetical protein
MPFSLGACLLAHRRVHLGRKEKPSNRRQGMDMGCRDTARPTTCGHPQERGMGRRGMGKLKHGARLGCPSKAATEANEVLPSSVMWAVAWLASARRRPACPAEPSPFLSRPAPCAGVVRAQTHCQQHHTNRVSRRRAGITICRGRATASYAAGGGVEKGPTVLSGRGRRRCRRRSFCLEHVVRPNVSRPENPTSHLATSRPISNATCGPPPMNHQEPDPG